MTEGPGRNVFTWALIAVGALITTLCGLCTLSFAGMGLLERDSSEYGGMVLAFALVIGGVPTVVGALILAWGVRRRASRRRSPEG